MKAIGIERTCSLIKNAEVSLQKKNPFVHRLFSVPQANDNHVKQLYKSDDTLVTALEGYDVLVRFLTLPLTKNKDVEAALAFQAEPLLPYSAENAILGSQIIDRQSDHTSLAILSVRKDLLEKHLNYYRELKIEPEIVSSVQLALCYFSQFYIPIEKPVIIFHLNEKSITGLLIKQGKLKASYSCQEGLQCLYQVQEEGKSSTPPAINEIDFAHLNEKNFSKLAEALIRLKQSLTKIHYALSKEIADDHLEGIVITGEGASLIHLDEYLAQHMNLPLIKCLDFQDGISQNEKLQYAVPIGLALAALPVIKEKVNFRQQEFAYPFPWKKIKPALLTYCACIFAVTAAFYFFGQHYLLYQEDKIKQDYADLLTAMNKSHESFEASFLAKNPLAREKANDEIVNIAKLNREDLLERLLFLQKDLQATPDSFPLFANIPQVSDVLAWLSQHPYVVHKNEEGILEPRLQLENFIYTMLKRPMQGKKQEKYQVKVELEFSSPTPKWAREFHDALIAPNDLVDPKGEVKWSSNRGKYRTSFYLKDKTSYPGQ